MSRRFMETVASFQRERFSLKLKTLATTQQPVASFFGFGVPPASHVLNIAQYMKNLSCNVAHVIFALENPVTNKIRGGICRLLGGLF